MPRREFARIGTDMPDEDSIRDLDVAHVRRRYQDRWGYYKRPQMQWSKKRNWAHRRQLFIEANFTCRECGYRPPDELIPANYDGSVTIGDLVIDHIVPLWNDGDRAGSNLQVLCKRCNGRKC